MKVIGILYICTGPYALFWNDFYNTFEQNFLGNTEKRYFVFTDSDTIVSSKEKRTKVIKIDNQPWPLITLLRFRTFLSIESELNRCDYLMFSNANIICDEKITEDEFLPNGKDCLFVTTHPGYYEKSIIDFPYDRNKNSLAYVPWNCGHDYVIGAMFGGTSEAFIEMSKKLKSNIEEGLKRNVIARWHDESHLNRYIIGRNDVRILPPEYCYPYGMNVNYKKRISAVSKQEKFDVKSFKGQYSVNYGKLKKIREKINQHLKLKEHIYFIRDSIMRKKI